jgi:hypothetical protein
MSNYRTTERLWPIGQEPPAREIGTYGPLWCAACAGLVWMVTLEEAASIARVTVETLKGRITNRSLHCMRPTAETLLICCDSLV